MALIPPTHSFIAPRRMARMPGPRAILHIDMDAFFASIEQATNPSLVGKPIAVVGSKKRTVIVTSSYEARKLGVKTGMTATEGKRACPELILVPGNNRRYIDASVRILAILRDYSPDVEVFSIDEAFVDVTGSLRLFGGADRIAREIKRRIADDLHITCSVGVAPNKLVAKLVSGFVKPDGLTIVTEPEIAPLMEPMPIEEICGIGSRLGKTLKGLGITTCGELGRYPVSVLKDKFGVVGERLHWMGLGVDETPIVPLGQEDAAKSIGHSMTFPYDVDDEAGIHRYLLLLSAKVGRRLQEGALLGQDGPALRPLCGLFRGRQAPHPAQADPSGSGRLPRRGTRPFDPRDHHAREAVGREHDQPDLFRKPGAVVYRRAAGVPAGERRRRHQGPLRRRYPVGGVGLRLAEGGGRHLAGLAAGGLTEGGPEVAPERILLLRLPDDLLPPDIGDPGPGGDLPSYGSSRRSARGPPSRGGRRPRRSLW